MMLERKHTVGQIRTIQLSEQLKFVSKSFLSTQNWTLVLIQSTGQNGRYTCVSSVSNKEMVKLLYQLLTCKFACYMLEADNLQQRIANLWLVVDFNMTR